MRTWTLAFLLGIIFLQFLTILPAKIYCIFTFITGLLIQKKFPRFQLISAILFGFTWTLWFAHHLNSWNLPHELESKSISIQGYVASIPEQKTHGTAFLFELTQVQSNPVSAYIKLSTQHLNLHPGEEWQFTAHLKQIHGLMNPGGFDYEAFAWQNGIRAQGYVIEREKNILVSNHAYYYFLTRLRQKLLTKIQENLPVSNTSPWIAALALGERENISPENWQILRNTGTNHLMAIAGLHIGFLSSFIYLLVSALWRCSPRLTLKFPAPLAGGIAALLMAFIYSALAGFSIPTQRACVMISTALLILLMRRKILSWQGWSMAMLSVLLLNPLSVLSVSFWLSFGSVAFIIYGVSGRLNMTSIWWKVGRLQWVVSLGLIPLGIWLFQQCSFVSFAANCIAIPCVGFVIVPLTLLGCFLLIFSGKLGGIVLLGADKILSWLWCILTFLSHLSWASWYQTISVTWILLAGCCAMILFLFPAGMPGRWLGFIWILPIIFFHTPTPAHGEIFFTLLDVGQGLASVVQTQHHTLVFDTGPKLSAEYDMGENVVVPFLHAIQADKVDMLVVSHGDNDHIGGSEAILKNFSVTDIKTSVPEKFINLSASHCLQGQAWDWDGVHFEFLYPTLDNLNLDNDSSCVLKITNSAQQSILLTGDIEKFAEKILVETEKNKLSATILVAPHHGSKTSAVDNFLDAVHPVMVLFPVGYLNRFHFPHPEVIEKYQQRKVQMYATDQVGAIQVDLNGSLTLQKYRLNQQHYWSHIG